MECERINQWFCGSSSGTIEFSHANSTALCLLVNTQRHICAKRIHHSLGWCEACARNSASLVDSNSQQGDVSAESADHAVVSASPIDNSSRQGDASADAAEHALESARLVDVSRTQGKDTITDSSGNTSLKMPVSMVGHRGHENALRSNVDGHDSAHNGVYDSACHSSQSSDGTPVRCCLCGRQFHRECIEFSENDTPLVWTCVHCRNLASDVKSANTKIDTLTSLVRDLIQKCIFLFSYFLCDYFTNWEYYCGSAIIFCGPQTPPVPFNLSLPVHEPWCIYQNNIWFWRLWSMGFKLLEKHNFISFSNALIFIYKWCRTRESL